MKVFVERLRELRNGMSQCEFANKIGAKQTSYSSWERGIKEPGISVLTEIASTFGVSTDWLLGLSDSRGGSSAPAQQKIIDAQPDVLREIRELKKRVNALESSSSMATCG